MRKPAGGEQQRDRAGIGPRPIARHRGEADPVDLEEVRGDGARRGRGGGAGSERRGRRDREPLEDAAELVARHREPIRGVGAEPLGGRGVEQEHVLHGLARVAELVRHLVRDQAAERVPGERVRAGGLDRAQLLEVAPRHLLDRAERWLGAVEPDGLERDHRGARSSASASVRR